MLMTFLSELNSHNHFYANKWLIYYFDVIISVHDLTNKKLYCTCGHVTKVFCNSSISMTEVIITKILKRFDQKTFFRGWSWFKFNNLSLALGIALKFYIVMTKGLEIKVKKFLGLICKSYRGKTGRMGWEMSYARK